MKFYSIRHMTRFEYDLPINESLMEVRIHPRTDTNQRCFTFSLSVSPRCRVFSYRDFIGNNVHHFNIPGRHGELMIVGRALVELQELADIPDALSPSAWQELDDIVSDGDYWEMLLPSKFAKPTPALLKLATEFGAVRRDDPLTVLREINTRLHDAIAYVPRSTRVDSPIDEALESRAGVCQDFSHIMIALVRHLGIPCRYVSGYLYHRPTDHVRSTASATHAWVDAFLPRLGWVGFDPTNDLLAHESHIRTALGRDYDDVPPNRGVYRGITSSELRVNVQVTAHDTPPQTDEEWPMPEDWSVHVERTIDPLPLASPILHLQQMEQQQQLRTKSQRMKIPTSSKS
ncbi:transglutaminase family protein [Acidobacterium sp. S8]|uniref:transglutaminase family protein n=1 Tax=Acidobacterium sp. S8 TaxID=1641854 RepID=UPI00131BBAA9|nr:transglutaminase family protein [Acidobacterium sp. S8]